VGEARLQPWHQNLRGLEVKVEYTGKRPEECEGFHDGTLYSLPLPTFTNPRREDVQAYFDNGWALTESLFTGLQSEESFYVPPYHELRHPMIFYYGHVATFFINKLRVVGLLENGLNPEFEELFEVGVDEMSWDDLSKNDQIWPVVNDVSEYRKAVHRIVTELITKHFPSKHDTSDEAAAFTVQKTDPLRVIFMAMEHERIHLETSSVLLREMPKQYLKRPTCLPPDFPSYRETAPANNLIPLEPRETTLGKPREYPTFSWDVSYGSKKVNIEGPVSASKFLVSNGEYLEFVKAGGYTEKKYWTEDGWGFRAFRNQKWPAFWIPDGPQGLHNYKIRTIWEERQLEPSWPVEVTHHEARAFCNWKGTQLGKPTRLPTEGETKLMKDSRWISAEDWVNSDLSVGIRGVDPVVIGDMSVGNMNFRYSSASPVDNFRATSKGFHDVLGNVWEHVLDEFNPLPGFQVDPAYTDFSTPCFDGLHHMIMGGSFISTGEEASVFARFHFRPHFQQHAGFRYVVSEADPDGAKTVGTVSRRKTVLDGTKKHYEDEALLNQYVLLHYGTPEQTFGPEALENAPVHAFGFPRRCADLVAQHYKPGPWEKARALDLGCAVGGSSFGLSQHGFTEVTGVDLSSTFIDTCNLVREQLSGPRQQIPFSIPGEGERMRDTVALLPEMGPDYSKTQFLVGDACSVPNELFAEPFDAILMANLLCRLPDPRRCLDQLPGLTKPGSVVVITSPCTWLEAFTPRDKWLGGTDAESSFEALQAELHPNFDLLERRGMPLVIRETARKFQYIVSDATVWRRKS